MAFQQRKNNRPNWFKQQIQRLGPNFLDRMYSADVQVGSIRALRDIVRGNYDLETDAQYILSPKFLEPCIVAVRTKLALHNTHYLAMTVFVQTVDQSDMTITICEHDRKAKEAYEIILSNLERMQVTEDINYLMSMNNNLTREMRNLI